MRSHRAVGVYKVVRANQKQRLFLKMGYYCTVPQCTSLAGKTKNVKFHRFPRDTHQADKWNDILKRGKPYTKYSKVCSLHFTQSDYNVAAMGQWKTLSKEALPSQNLPRLKADGTPLVIRKSRTVKYRDVQVKKEIDAHTNGEIVEEKWRHGASVGGSSVPSVATLPAASVASVSSVSSVASVSSVGCSTATQDGVHSPLHDAVAYRLHSLSALAENLAQQHSHSQHSQHSQVSQHSHSQSEERPHKQDAIMQTDPLSEDEQLLSNTFSDHSESSFQSDTPSHTHTHATTHTHTQARDYSKSPTDEFKYKQYQQEVYQTHSPGAGGAQAQNYQQVDTKIEYQSRPDSQGYPYGYVSCADTHTHTHAHAHAQAHTHTHTLLLQEQMYQQHKYEEETRVKQEVDDYERGADIGTDVSTAGGYSDRARLQERLQLMVKSEPDPLTGCEQVPAPVSPYYQSSGQLAGGYYTQYSRQAERGAPTAAAAAAPHSHSHSHSNSNSNSNCNSVAPGAPGAELLIAKQNALAAHTQLWQNTMKRPFFYSESAHYATSGALQRYEL